MPVSIKNHRFLSPFPQAVSSGGEDTAVFVRLAVHVANGEEPWEPKWVRTWELMRRIFDKSEGWDRVAQRKLQGTG